MDTWCYKTQSRMKNNVIFPEITKWRMPYFGWSVRDDDPKMSILLAIKLQNKMIETQLLRVS